MKTWQHYSFLYYKYIKKTLVAELFEFSLLKKKEETEFLLLERKENLKIKRFVFINKNNLYIILKGVYMK